MSLIFILLSACQQTQTPVAYSSATLDPPFEHGNSGWAGVALLDYDNDGLLDIFFTNGLSQPDALYRNIGDGNFKDIAETVGLASTEQHGAVASGDLDNDGDPDLVLTKDCSLGTLNEDGNAIPDGEILVYWNQNGQFEEQRLGLPPIIQERGTCPVSVELVDTNLDGLLDISVSNGMDLDQTYPWIYRKIITESTDFIYLNDTEHSFSTFASFFAQLGTEIHNINDMNEPPEDLQRVTFTSAYIDIDRNGFPDKISGHGGGMLSVYLQNQEGFYVLDGKVTGPEGLWMGMALADFDGDSDIDIYATNQGLSPLILGYDNIPWDGLESIGEGQFRESEVLNPFHSVYLFDGEAFEFQADWSFESENLLPGDLFDGMPDENGMLRYPEWKEPENLRRLGWSWGATAVDIDADGWMDVVFNGNNCAAPMSIIGSEERGAGPGGVLRNQAGQGLQDMTWKWGLANLDANNEYPDGRGLAVGDLNNDGFPDIVFANRSYNPSQSGPLEQIAGTPNIFLSQGHPNNWLQIDLVGEESNRDGIGSMIRIDDDETSKFYIFEAGGTTNSSNERLFTVGLGQQTKVTVKILFPSGTKCTIKKVRANQRITIKEGECSL